MIEDRIKGVENSKSTRVTDAKGAKVKQLLHDFLSHPWVDCEEAADGADGRAECGKPLAENEGPAGGRAVTAIENPRRQRRA